jgi:hypothetical protein
MSEEIEILLKIGNNFYYGILKPYVPTNPQEILSTSKENKQEEQKTETKQEAKEKVSYELPGISPSQDEYALIKWLKNRLKDEQAKGHLSHAITEDGKKIIVDVEFEKIEDKEKVNKWIEWIKKKLNQKNNVVVQRSGETQNKQ